MLTTQKIALPLTHSSVNGPSEKLTGLDNGLCHNDNTLEKENIDAILHMDQPCNATELCMFIGYVNYCCTCCRVVHISLNLLMDQSNLTTYFMDRQNAESICTMHLLMAARA
jgi:hypothetical protein